MKSILKDCSLYPEPVRRADVEPPVLDLPVVFLVREDGRVDGGQADVVLAVPTASTDVGANVLVFGAFLERYSTWTQHEKWDTMHLTMRQPAPVVALKQK